MRLIKGGIPKREHWFELEYKYDENYIFTHQNSPFPSPIYVGCEKGRPHRWGCGGIRGGNGQRRRVALLERRPRHPTAAAVSSTVRGLATAVAMAMAVLPCMRGRNTARGTIIVDYGSAW